MTHALQQLYANGGGDCPEFALTGTLSGKHNSDTSGCMKECKLNSKPLESCLNEIQIIALKCIENSSFGNQNLIYNFAQQL